MSRRVVLIVLALCSLSPLWPTSAQAQEPALWPGAKYDPAIPTIKQVLGHDHGEVITPPEGVAQYLQALQKAAPTRTRLIEYAKTWEGRPLWLFVVGSADRIAEVRRNRAVLLADRNLESYVDRDAISAEIAYTRKVAATNGWPIIDVTRRSIEESATMILKLMHDRKAGVKPEAEPDHV